MRRFLSLLALAFLPMLSSAQNHPMDKVAMEVFRSDVERNLLRKNNFQQTSPYNTGVLFIELSELQAVTDSLINDRLDSLLKQIPSAVYGVTSLKVARWNAAYNWGPHAGKYDTLGHRHTFAQIDDLGSAAVRSVPTTGNASGSQVVLGSDTRLPGAWTTGTRPESPAAGRWGYNSTLNGMEYWNGTTWILF